MCEYISILSFLIFGKFVAKSVVEVSAEVRLQFSPESE